MRRWSAFLLVVVLDLALAGSTAAQEPTPGSSAPGSTEALLDALARVPATSETLAAPVTYVDYRAVEASRPGAATPASLADLLELQAADDPSADRWLAAAQGIASGPSDLHAMLLSHGPAWPDSVGFDFFDIDRAVELGSPPSDGVVLVGEFQPDAIAGAHEGRGYRATTVGERTLWCGDAGCDAGLLVDPSRRDPNVPFGGLLGRQEPLAASSRDVLSSPDLRTLEDMIAAADGEAARLADQPAYRAMALSPAEDVAVLQATFLPVGALLLAPDLAVLGALAEGPDVPTELLPSLEPMAVPLAVGIIDGATSDQQVVTVVLVFLTTDDASAAAEVVARRLGTVPSLTRGQPMADLLEERGASVVESRVEPASDERLPAAVIELRAPLAGHDPDAGGATVAASSEIYRLLIGLVLSRDLLWLVPSPGPA